MKQSDINKGRIRMWFGPLFFGIYSSPRDLF